MRNGIVPVPEIPKRILNYKVAREDGEGHIVFALDSGGKLWRLHTMPEKETWRILNWNKMGVNNECEIFKDGDGEGSDCGSVENE